MNKRNLLINYLEYFYKNFKEDTAGMEQILYQYNASNNEEAEDGLYASMSINDLIQAAQEFHKYYGYKVPGSTYLLFRILDNSNEGLSYMQGYIQAYKDLGKDIHELEQLIELV